VVDVDVAVVAVSGTPPVPPWPVAPPRPETGAVLDVVASVPDGEPVDDPRPLGTAVVVDVLASLPEVECPPQAGAPIRLAAMAVVARSFGNLMRNAYPAALSAHLS